MSRDDETVETVITKLIVERYGVSEGTIRMIIQMFLLPLLKSLKRLPKPELPEIAPVDLKQVYSKKEWTDREKVRIFWWATMHDCIDILKYLHERFPALSDHPGIYNESNKLKNLLINPNFEVLQCLHDMYCLTSDDFPNFGEVLWDNVGYKKHDVVKSLVKIFGYHFVDFGPMETAILNLDSKMVNILWEHQVGVDNDHNTLKQMMKGAARDSIRDEVVDFVDKCLEDLLN